MNLTIFTPNRLCIIPLEITRNILSRFVFRGRYRIGYITTRMLMPSKKLILRHRYGDAMVFDFGNRHEISMYFDFFAPDLSKIMKDLLKPGDLFIDCGANIGYFACIGASLVGRGGVVMAVDANPYCINRIQESKKVGDYSNLEIVPVAIGDHNGDIEFNLADDPMYSSLADLNRLDFTSTNSTITVPLRKLDDILLERNIAAGRKIRLVKIDVEGAELDVIRGAENSINAKTLDYLYVEVHEKQMRLRGQDPQELYTLLAARGFSKVQSYHGGQNTLLFQSNEI